MKIYNLDIVRMPLLPHEAKSILLGDANAMLTGSVSFELFQNIAAQDLQVSELDGRIENHELSTCATEQFSGKNHAFCAFVDGFGLH